MREYAASIMRAPPLDEMMMSGCFFFNARSIALAIFSPTTEPILPPMNPKSMQAMTTGIPLISAVPVRTASLSPLFRIESFRRWLYGLVSSNFKGSTDFIASSVSFKDFGSRSISKYSLLPIRK